MKRITAIYGSTYKDLERENKQLEDLLHKANDEVISYTNCCIDLKDKIDKAIEFIKNGIDFKSLHFIRGKDEDMWKIILIDNIKEELLEILEGKE